MPHDISTTFWRMSVVHLLLSWSNFGRDNYFFVMNYFWHIMKADGGMQFCIKFTYFSLCNGHIKFSK